MELTLLKFYPITSFISFVFLKMPILFYVLNEIHFYFNTDFIFFCPAHSSHCLIYSFSFWILIFFPEYPFFIVIMYNLKQSKKLYLERNWSAKINEYKWGDPLSRQQVRCHPFFVTQKGNKYEVLINNNGIMLFCIRIQIMFHTI